WCWLTSVIFTLSLHDALPIWFLGKIILNFSKMAVFSKGLFEGLEELHHTVDRQEVLFSGRYLDHGLAVRNRFIRKSDAGQKVIEDRKSTRLNSSHVKISYAVF